MENKFKYIVYQTINIVNNKIYIGWHKTKDPNVFDGYIGNGVNINYPSTYMNPKWPFQYAVKKYGTNKFKRSVLYIFDTAEEALLKERELVNEDFVKRSDTYNLILGGHLRPLEYISKKVYQFDTTGKFLKEWEDCSEVANFLETWKESVYSAISARKRLYGFYWSYEDNIDITKYTNPNEPNKTYKYNQDGKCVAIYNSEAEAARENGYEPKILRSRIREQALTKGFYYSNTLYDEYIPRTKLNLKKEILYLYDIDGNFIDSFNYADFKKYLGITTTGRLATCVRLEIPYMEKYQVRIEKFDKLPPYVPKSKSKPILVYLKDGTFYKEYESVNQAIKELNLDSSTVHKILRGAGKFTKGYTMKYKI